MKAIKFWTIIIIALVLVVISVVLFGWSLWGQLNSSKPIDADRFADFGSFIGGIFGSISFILLVITLKETKDQSFDTTFFNHLQLHDSVVRELKGDRQQIATLNEEYQDLFKGGFCDTLSDELREECRHYSTLPQDGFFEVLYAILHVHYKYGGQNLGRFFQKYQWRVGHFLDSFVSVVEMISESQLNERRRHFYGRILRSRSTSDELRLAFYFITSYPDPTERDRLVKLFRSVNVFGRLRDVLIKPEDNETLRRNFS